MQMKKTILKLVDIVDLMSEELGYGKDNTVTISTINVDDIFGILRKRGIKEIIVSFHEMFLIITFTIANIQQYNNEQDMKWEALKLIQDGLMDKFFGVKLILEDATRSHAAIMAIGFNQTGFSSGQVTNLININQTRFIDAIRTLKEKYTTDFIEET